MATGDPDFLTNEPVPLYVPMPFPATYPRHSQTPNATPPSGGGAGSGGTTENGAVYAAALFLNAYCEKADRIGAWVRATDATSTVRTTTSQLSYPAIGVIVSKTSDTTCVVQTYGLCGGIYSGMTPNLRMFVGPTGQATAGKDLPSGTAYVQPIGFSVRADTIFVQPSGVLFRRDAAPDAQDPAPAPSGGSTTTYQPVLHGVGAPNDGIGRDGDGYIDTATLTFYSRTSAGWDAGRPIATQGAAGRDGKDAPLPYAGDGPPDALQVGPAGQIYIDRINAALYVAQA